VKNFYFYKVVREVPHAQKRTLFPQSFRVAPVASQFSWVKTMAEVF